MLFGATSEIRKANKFIMNTFDAAGEGACAEIGDVVIYILTIQIFMSNLDEFD